MANLSVEVDFLVVLKQRIEHFKGNSAELPQLRRVEGDLEVVIEETCVRDHN